jgi:hypothetical protein
MVTKQIISEQSVGHERNKEGNQKIPRIKEDENTIYENIWDTVKAVLREKYIAEYFH